MHSLPPPISYETNNSKWNECQIKNARIHPLSGFLAQLLSGLGTNGTLRRSGSRQKNKNGKQNQQTNQKPLFHYAMI